MEWIFCANSTDFRESEGGDRYLAFEKISYAARDLVCRGVQNKGLLCSAFRCGLVRSVLLLLCSVQYRSVPYWPANGIRFASQLA